MTVPTHPAPTSDSDLLVRVREGDTEAYGVLYRRHADAARRLATVLARDGGEAEDLAAEAFARLLASLRGGGGPQTAFRPYLLTAVRNAFYDRVRRTSRVEPTDAIEDYEKPQPYEDPSIAALERSYAARAFARLPERWRAVLWHTEVEGETPTQIAPLFGLSANAVAVLAFRARERLKQGYLAEHITLTGSPRCHWTGEHLPGYVRANLAGRDRTKVEDHLAECAECRRLHRELTDANVSLRVVLAPLLLGGAAPAYLTSTASGAGLWTALLAALSTGSEAAKTVWWWLTTLPQRLTRRYGTANIAAAAGLVIAASAGVAVFVAAAVLFPAARTRHTDAADIPVPAPAQTAYAGPSAVMPPLAPITPMATSHAARPQLRTARSPAPVAEAMAVRPGTSSAGLVAGGVSRIPLTFSRAESATIGHPESAVLSAFTAAAPLRSPNARSWEFALDLPAGFRLAGPDAGDRWTCRTAAEQVLCKRPGVTATSTARVPVAIDASVSGYQTITIRLPRKATSLRVPVAPAGMRVAYAGSGRLAATVGGNALLSCVPRPACLNRDNNALSMLPLLPSETEPGPPSGLFNPGGPTTPTGRLPELAGPKAASGALVDIPRNARVRWAGLTVTASDGKIPDLVALHGQDSGWHPVHLNAPRKAESPDIEMQQAYADVTRLVQTDVGGFWWVASLADQLPTGPSQYAGWTLAVVYESAGAPQTEVAAYAGPVAVEGSMKVTVKVSGPASIGTAVSVWDGDRLLEGDRLTVGGRPMGNDGNFAHGDTPTATAVACAAHNDGCVWRTPGADIAQYATSTWAPSAVTIEAGHDPLGIGLLLITQSRTR